MNTKQAFGGLEEGLRSIGQKAMMDSVASGIQANFNNAPGLPKELFQDDYFRKNLPASYGSLGDQSSLLQQSELQSFYDVEKSVFGEESERCSKGFQDLSKNLKSIPDPAQHNTPLDYSKLNDGLLNALNQTTFQQDSEEGTQKNDKSLDYNHLSKNLSVFESSIDTSSGPFSMFRNETSSETRTTSSTSKPEVKTTSNSTSKPVVETTFSSQNVFGETAKSSFCYQNVTNEAMGYTKDSVNVRPYAITKYNFVAESDHELGFSAGEMIYLNRYVDQEWVEGEIDNHKGMFPINYVNIIVDCDTNYSEKSTAVTVHDNLLPDTYHKVLYNFHAQMDGDITVAEGEVIRIKEQQNVDWVVVENSQGESGVMPGNHLDPETEFDGKALFDIERLLSYKLKKDQQEALKHASKEKMDDNHKKGPNLDELKFFDPLRSPDSEMMRIEEQLQLKAKEPKVIPLSDNKVVINASRKNHEGSNVRYQPKQPKDIESLISNNLSKLRSTSPKGEKILTPPTKPKDKIPISEMVLHELRGKITPQKRQNSETFSQELIRLGSLKRQSRKSPAPPRPKLPPAPPLVQKKPIKPPAPPPPQISTCLDDDEPLYSSVRKASSSKESLGSSCSSSSSPPPPTHPPPLLHSMSLPCQPSSELESENPPMESNNHAIEVEVQVHQGNSDYETADYSDHPIQKEAEAPDRTPTNENILLRESLDRFPSLPRRSSSIRPPGAIGKSYIHQSFHANHRILGPPTFPPDKKSPLSPTSSDIPPKVDSLPCRRSASVSSSIKSKSMTYASV